MKFLKDIRNFVEGNVLYFADYLSNGTIAPHVKEQALRRAFLCQDCLALGHCKGCGCPTPKMFFSPNKTDSEGKWGLMLDKEAWEIFKQQDTSSIPLTFEEILEIYHGKTRSDNSPRPSEELLGSESASETDPNLQQPL